MLGIISFKGKEIVQVVQDQSRFRWDINKTDIYKSEIRKNLEENPNDNPTLTQCIKEVAEEEKLIITSKGRKGNKPWFDKDCKDIKKNLNKARLIA